MITVQQYLFSVHRCKVGLLSVRNNSVADNGFTFIRLAVVASQKCEVAHHRKFELIALQGHLL